MSHYDGTTPNDDALLATVEPEIPAGLLLYFRGLKRAAERADLIVGGSAAERVLLHPRFQAWRETHGHDAPPTRISEMLDMLNEMLNDEDLRDREVLEAQDAQDAADYEAWLNDPNWQLR